MSSVRLGDYLIREGKLRPEQLERALETQKLVGGRLGTNLLELGLVSEDQLLKALGHLRATMTVSTSDLRGVQPEVIRMIPAKLATRYKLVPYLLKGKTIFIAAKDPGDPLQEDEIGFLTSCMVRTCIATELRLEIALRRFYRVNVDHRFLILGKRLAGAARSAQTAEETRAASPHVGSDRPTPPPAAIGTGAFARQDPAPAPAQTARPAVPSPPPAAAPGSKEQPASRPAASKPAASGPAAPEFIELDDDDLALLRRPAEPGEQPAPEPVPASTESIAAGPTGASAEAAEAEAWLEAVHAEEAASADEDLDVEERLMRASMALQEAEIRDEIGDALLRFAGGYYARRMLLISRRDRIFGWMGDGEGVSQDAVRAIDLEAQKPSVFAGLKEASNFWMGPLPPLPSNRVLSEALGGAPRDCLVLPVTLRGKVVCYLYVDNGPAEPDGGAVSGTPIAEMKRLVAKAGLAFEVYILKHKIRVS